MNEFLDFVIYAGGGFVVGYGIALWQRWRAKRKKYDS